MFKRCFIRLSQVLAAIGVICFTGTAVCRPMTAPVEDCSTVLEHESLPVKEAFGSACKYITSEHKCLVKNLNEVDDIGALINSLPDQTVLIIRKRKRVTDILIDVERTGALHFSKEHYSALAYQSSPTLVDLPGLNSISVSDSIPFVEFADGESCLPSKTAGRLPKDIVMLGVNENQPGGTIPVCEAERPHQISFMFELGSNDKFLDAGRIYVTGFSFFPLLDNNPDPVDSIWRVRCYTGELVFRANHFRLDTRASIYLQCTHETDQMVRFEFLENSVVGMGESRSEEGLMVDLRHVKPHYANELADIYMNYLGGNIKTGIEIRLDEGARAIVHENLIYPASTEVRNIRNALEIYGPNIADHMPEVIVRANQFRTEDIVAQLFGKLSVEFSRNKLDSKTLVQAKSYLLDDRWNTDPDIQLSSGAKNFWWSVHSLCPYIDGEESVKGFVAVENTQSGRDCSIYLGN